MHDFNKDVSKPTGLRSQCNACRSNRRQAQRSKARRHGAQTRSCGDSDAAKIKEAARKTTQRMTPANKETTLASPESVKRCLQALPKSERLLEALLTVAEYERNLKTTPYVL